MADREPPAPAAGWDAAYIETPPWDIGRPQRALASLIDAGIVGGRVLDSGCGTGELALLAASHGLETSGIDLSARAIAMAQKKARERGLEVRFEVGDALDLRYADESFDTVMDSGVFHVFGDAERARYVTSIRRVLVPGGMYHLAVFSDAQPGDWGPRRVARDEIDAAFATGWRVREVVPATFEVTFGEVQAWRATVERAG